MARNLTDALQETLRSVMHEGNEVHARGQNQREIMGHIVRMSSPQERVVVLPGRKNNIFAQIAETLWVISGRNDLDFLSHYLPRAVDFSDDGKTWRAAYGPRLRKWAGNTDQLKGVLQRFKEDPNTKRAVASIFDPASDFAESKDVPCNNWLNFIQRDGRLHMNVSVRANDVIWGFSGINVFEWSVTQELIASSLGLVVGNLNWFVGSMHVYDRHYGIANRIISQGEVESPYQYGIRSLPITSDLETFDALVEVIFMNEENYRNGMFEPRFTVGEDPFLAAADAMLCAYNLFLHEESDEKLVAILNTIPPSDFRVAAVEYFARSRGFEAFSAVQLTIAETAFLEFHARCASHMKTRELVGI